MWVCVTSCIDTSRVNTDAIKAIQEKIKPFYQDDVPPEILTYSNQISEWFRDVKILKDSIIIASFFLWLITIMGILGYVNLEIRRRTKEIAIRKIHGSTAIAIIWRVSRELLLMALLAAVVAIPLSYISLSIWQRDFFVKAALNWYLFVGAMFVIVLTIAVCAILQTWRTASANPARAIKSE
jgi:putative ABC transport system permease protein